MTRTANAAPAATDESVEDFRLRARKWLSENMKTLDTADALDDRRDEVSGWDRARVLQKKLYDGGFAGICFPVEYGGLGLPRDYQRAFSDEAEGYEMPTILNTPTFTICAATLLDTASEQQKIDRIGAAIRGEEVLVQLLSEPRGGSDLAGVTTKAELRDGRWVLNGAKTWSTSAFAADYGLCLARTDWTVPKHDGLTMFLVPLNAPGITMRRIVQISGGNEFCEEYFDDVVLDEDAVVGEVNKGWDVASRQMYHERRAVGRSSEFASGPEHETSDAPLDFIGLVRELGREDDPAVAQPIGRATAYRLVRDQLADHIFESVSAGTLPAAAGSIIRVFMSDVQCLDLDTAVSLLGSAAVVGDSGPAADAGRRFLSRQTGSLGGGTTEISRNIVAERVLGMPREYAADKGVPFNQVKQGR